MFAAMKELAVDADERRRHRMITRLAKAGLPGLKRRELIRCGSSNERNELSATLNQFRGSGIAEVVDERWRLTAEAVTQLAWFFPATAQAYADTAGDSFWQREQAAAESAPELADFWA